MQPASALALTPARLRLRRRPIASLTVRAANGWFDLAVTDPTQRTARAFSTANIHRIPNLPEIPPDITSYKLYYVNYNLRLFNGPVDGLWISLFLLALA